MIKADGDFTKPSIYKPSSYYLPFAAEGDARTKVLVENYWCNIADYARVTHPIMARRSSDSRYLVEVILTGVLGDLQTWEEHWSYIPFTRTVASETYVATFYTPYFDTNGRLLSTTQSVPTFIETRYYIGFNNVPILTVPKVWINSSGELKRSSTYNEYATPTSVVEESKVEQWKGNIYARHTRYMWNTSARAYLNAVGP